MFLEPDEATTVNGTFIRKLICGTGSEEYQQVDKNAKKSKGKPGKSSGKYYELEIHSTTWTSLRTQIHRNLSHKNCLPSGHTSYM